MDYSQVNWAYVGFPVMAVSLAVFVACAMRRQWTIGALVIGLAHLPMAFIHAAAPFRGLLDPTYAGYVGGLVHAAKGFEVFVFSGFMLVGATASAAIIVLNRPGLRNGLVVMFDFIALLLFATPVIAGFLSGGFANERVEFGEYLQFGGVSAFIFTLALTAAPFLVGLLWAWRKLTEAR